MGNAEMTQSQQPGTQGQVIKSREGIYRLLSRLKAQHTPLKLAFDSVAEHYTSMILAVNYQEGYFLMDEVMPSWGDELMAKAVGFSFDSFHDGCKMSAEGLRASGRAIKDGSPIYKVAFPDAIDFLQRRQFYRAPVRYSLNIQVRLGVVHPPVEYDEFNNPIIKPPVWAYEGLLRDLSAQGCQVEVPGDLREQLANHTEFADCEVIFPNGHVIHLGLVVRHVGYDENKELTGLGCQFLQLNPRLDRQISFVVTELQRDNARATSGHAATTPVSELFTPLEPSAKKSKKEKPKDEAEEAAAGAEQDEVDERDPSSVHRFAVNAVQQLVNQLRAKQPLAIQQAWRAADLLLELLEQQRQELILLTRVRSTHQYLYEHSVSVAVMLADQALFDVNNPKSRDKTYLRNLIFAGLCHDLGKGLIPERIIGKTGNLTEQEAKVMHKHSLLTREILSRQPGTPEIALQVATQNCERLDGSGHPEHLKSLSLSPIGKLAAVIDVFDAMTNGRSYRAGLPHALAYKRLLGMGQQLEASWVQQLIKRQGIFPIGSLVAFEQGHLGFVKTLDAANKPQLVRLVYNKLTQQPLPLEDIELGSAPAYERIVAPEDPAKYQLSNQVLLDSLG
ncbi:HD domain-containing phosphohydrolase [Marinospirillum sp. MEB164]|uniref:HD domain-containing phosphohydrolase n=1 Tax=Marinospirillum alkalitolerans TaxID=3123374 RepID=A0ABW8PZA4_9GAMM